MMTKYRPSATERYRSRKRSLREKTLRSISSVFGIQLVKRALAFFVYLMLYRYLESGDFGIYALCETFLAMIMVISDFGMEDALTRIRGISLRRILSVGLSLRILIASCTLVIFWAGSGVISASLNQPGLLWPLRVIALTALANAIGFRSVVVLKRKILFERFFWPELIAQLSSSFLALIMAFSGFHYWSLLTVAIGNYWVRSLILHILKRRVWSARWDTDLSKIILHKSLWGLLVTFLYLLVSRISLIWGGRYLGLETLGFYYLAFNWSNFIVTYGVQYTSRVMFPAFAQLESNRSRVIQTFREYFHRVTLISISFNFGLAALAPRLIPLLAGDKWIPAVPMCQAMCFYGMIRALQSPPQTLLYSLGRFRKLTEILALEGCVLVILLWMMRGYGIQGMFLPLYVSKVLGTFLCFQEAKKMLSLPRNSIFATVFREMGAGLAALSGVLIFSAGCSMIPLHSVFVLGFSGLMGVLIYIKMRKLIPSEGLTDITPFKEDLDLLIRRSNTV